MVAGNKSTSERTEADRHDLALVAKQLELLFAGCRIPNSNRLIVAGGRQPALIGREFDPIHFVRVARADADVSLCLCVPHAGGPILSGRREPSAVPGKRDKMDVAGMARNEAIRGNIPTDSAG